MTIWVSAWRNVFRAGDAPSARRESCRRRAWRRARRRGRRRRPPRRCGRRSGSRARASSDTQRRSRPPTSSSPMMSRSWVAKKAKTMRSPRGRGDAEDDRLPPQIGRQAGRRHADDDGVVAGKHQVDDDDGGERGQFRDEYGIHGSFWPVRVVRECVRPQRGTGAFAAISFSFLRSRPQRRRNRGLGPGDDLVQLFRRARAGNDAGDERDGRAGNCSAAAASGTCGRRRPARSP